MSHMRSNADADLEASLRRIRGALQSNRNRYAAIVEQIMAETGAEVAERVTTRFAERHQRRVERWRRRHARYARRAEGYGNGAEDVSRGVVFVVAAVACLAFAVFRPQMWWLIFVGMGLGMSAASAFGRATRRKQAEPSAQPEKGAASPTQNTARPVTVEAKPAPPVDPPDPRVARIQALCDKLLAELESGPPIVREVMTQPKETIGGLRQACLEIARRERELRDVLATQEEAALVAERNALVERLSNEHDEIVRDRLGQALRALEQQLAHRAELATAATRLEAENTRILYTLESLRMQLLRARSTDIGAPELGGKLRESLRELGTEIDAVAEALEWASAPTGGDKGAVPPRTPATTASSNEEQAERLAAARRAAQMRDAERR